MPTDDQAGGNLRAMIASAITDNIRKAAETQTEQPPVQQPPAQPPVQQLPAQPPVQQPPVQQPPVQPPAPEVSTGPVDQVDIGAMFRTPTTDAPAAPPPLPPDSPVQAPPEIEQNEKAKSAWEILRNRERESRHRAEALQAQLEEATRQAGAVAEERAKFAAELQGRDDRIRELEDRLGKADLASSPEFRRQYDEKMESVSGSFADALRDAAEIDDEDTLADTVQKLLATTDAEFTRLVSKLPSTAQGSLWDKRREYRSIATARENAISEWRSAQAGVAKVDEQRQVVERAERRNALAEQAIDFTNTKIDPRHRPSVLAEATYRQDVESANQQFRGFMQVASDDELARVAYQGFLVPVMQRQVAFLAEAVGKWRDAYYALRGAGSPPALPIRVQSETPPPPAAPVAPRVEDRGTGFSNVVQDTLANTIRSAMGR